MLGFWQKKLLDELPENEVEVLKIGNVQIKASTPDTPTLQDSEFKMMETQADESPQSIAINKGTVRVRAELFVEYQIK